MQFLTPANTINFFLFHAQPPHRPYLQRLLSLGHCKRTVPVRNRSLFQIVFPLPRIPASSCSASFSRTGSVGFYRPVLSAQLLQKTLPLSKFFLPPRIPASSCPASFSRTGFLAICGPAISAQPPQKALPLFNFFLPLTPKTSCSISENDRTNCSQKIYTHRKCTKNL